MRFDLDIVPGLFLHVEPTPFYILMCKVTKGLHDIRQVRQVQTYECHKSKRVSYLRRLASVFVLQAFGHSALPVCDTNLSQLLRPGCLSL